MNKLEHVKRPWNSGRIGWLLLLNSFGSLAGSARAQPVNINGAYDRAFGSALHVQTDATGFGATDNELDAAYGFVVGQSLYLFISGNLQDNANNLNIFIADGRSGQGTLAAVNPGKFGSAPMLPMPPASGATSPWWFRPSRPKPG